ncbi:hypothetical protein NDU88_004402 [Pleurodeles waltl]|uniref:Uncharacterized protein n=1 Tax=Pleurodeles waltl TaxID=8319 RepID=A0AAV7RJ31_PLEWA|nr:hypothetical protein NDU88_004402 [Pleurodeles waltl]
MRNCGSDLRGPERQVSAAVVLHWYEEWPVRCLHNATGAGVPCDQRHCSGHPPRSGGADRWIVIRERCTVTHLPTLKEE